MSLKAGWIAFFLFVWIIGAFLGSTYEYQNTDDTSGMAYTTGTATFITNNSTVLGIGTTWNNALMAGGLIKSNTDAVWYKIDSITDVTHLELTAVYAQAGGAGQAYTMQASPGFAGTGTGGYATAPITKLEYLTNINNATQQIELLGMIAFPVPNGEYFNILFEILTWRWSFMVEYEIFYWIVCAPFVAMGIFSLILLVYSTLTGNLSF